jgi:hypothetical protein
MVEKIIPNRRAPRGSGGFVFYDGNCEFIVPEAASNVHVTATMKNCVPAYKTDLNIP